MEYFFSLVGFSRSFRSERNDDVLAAMIVESAALSQANLSQASLKIPRWSFFWHLQSDFAAFSFSFYFAKKILQTESELKSLESGLEERRREEEVSARLQQLIQVWRTKILKKDSNSAPRLQQLIQVSRFQTSNRTSYLKLIFNSTLWFQLLESVVELNSGLEEREEETYLLAGQASRTFLWES